MKPQRYLCFTSLCFGHELFGQGDGLNSFQKDYESLKKVVGFSSMPCKAE